MAKTENNIQGTEHTLVSGQMVLKMEKEKWYINQEQCMMEDGKIISYKEQENIRMKLAMFILGNFKEEFSTEKGL